MRYTIGIVFDAILCPVSRNNVILHGFRCFDKYQFFTAFGECRGKKIDQYFSFYLHAVVHKWNILVCSTCGHSTQEHPGNKGCDIPRRFICHIGGRRGVGRYSCRKKYQGQDFCWACSWRDVSSSLAVTAVLPPPNSASRRSRALPIVSAGLLRESRRTTSAKGSCGEYLAFFMRNWLSGSFQPCFSWRPAVSGRCPKF